MVIGLIVFLIFNLSPSHRHSTWKAVLTSSDNCLRPNRHVHNYNNDHSNLILNLQPPIVSLSIARGLFCRLSLWILLIVSKVVNTRHDRNTHFTPSVRQCYIWWYVWADSLCWWLVPSSLDLGWQRHQKLEKVLYVQCLLEYLSL